MCTVSYLPSSNGKFTLTSNRDELTSRKSEAPQIYSYKNCNIIFPKDNKVFGSWIAMTEKRLICLLNGGFEIHERKDSYRVSRGVVVLDALVEKSIDDFVNLYHLVDVEPFTMIWVDLVPFKLFELVWDGNKLHKKQLANDQAHFWSSSTLYNLDWRTKRKAWFLEWLKSHGTDAKSIKDFHMNGGEQHVLFGFIMSRNNGQLKTISITQVEFDEILEMRHYDLIDGNTHTLTF